MGNRPSGPKSYFVGKNVRPQAVNRQPMNGANCLFCQKLVPEGTHLQHLKQCKKKPRDAALSCDFCGNRFLVDNDQYVEHCLICPENPENKMIPCNYCKMSYNMKQIPEHTRACGWNPNNIVIVCEYCEIKVPMSQHEEHFNTCSSHPNSVQIACEFCNAKLTVRKYEEHIMICRANPENIKIKCEYCGKKFNGNYYSQHVENCLLNSENNNGNEHDRECAICIMPFQPWDQTLFFACAHKFHRKCAVEWAKKQNFCAICMTEFDPAVVLEETPEQ